MKQTQRPSAFTLIEILVVMAIIALLASVLFAVFSRVREKGRSAACQSNLHQIALAIQQYTQDNNGRFPTGGLYRDPPPASTTSVDSIMPHLVLPYIKSSDIFWCSSNYRWEAPANTNYGYNGRRLGERHHNDNVGLWSTMMMESAIQNSADVWLCRDAPNGWAEGDGWDDTHSGGANYSFVDGHVKWFTLEGISMSQGSQPDVW